MKSLFSIRRAPALLLTLALLFSATAACAQPQKPKPAPRYRVLVFSKTEGFRHSSIPDGIAAIWRLGEKNNFKVDATENADVFRPDNLAQYKAVIFLSTTGDILNAAQQQAFEGYIASGGGFVGVHAAADTEYEWPWFGELVGGYFKSHPKQQHATIKVEDREHISTKHLPARWTRWDEWYNYQENPRQKVHVLASLDAGTYDGDEMSGDHPIAWLREVGGGRSWYTGLGHTEASFVEPEFLAHLLGGIEWAAGVPPLQAAK